MLGSVHELLPVMSHVTQGSNLTLFALWSVQEVPGTLVSQLTVQGSLQTQMFRGQTMSV